jgi:hypothetical protein
MSEAQDVAAIAVKPTAAMRDLKLSITAPIKYSGLCDWKLVYFQIVYSNVEL